MFGKGWMLTMKSMRRRIRIKGCEHHCWILFIAVFLALGPVKMARADEEAQDLGEMVVTGVKAEAKEKIAITGLSEAVEMDELQTTENLQRLQDLFIHLAGVDMVRTSTVTENFDPFKLRGFDSSRIAILLDGRPINKVGGMGSGNIDWSSLSLENVEKVVVVRGGNTALYGGAVGGVINIITRKELKDPEKQYEGNVSAEVASYDSKVAKGYAMGGLGPFTLSLGLNKAESDGFLRNNYYEALDMTGRLTYKMPTNGKITLGYKVADTEKGIPMCNDPDYPLSQYDPGYPIIDDVTSPYIPGGDNYWTKWMEYYDIMAEQPTGIGTFSLNLYLTKDEFKRRDYRFAFYMPTRTMEFIQGVYHYNRNETHGARLTHDLAFGDIGIIYGLDYQKMYSEYNVDSSFGNSFKEREPSLEWSAGFMEFRYLLNPKLETMLGLRYDDADYPSRDYQDHDSSLSPKFSLNYSFDEKSNAFLAISKVFRPPYANWEGGNKVYADPTSGWLDPDEGVQYEIGAQYGTQKFTTSLAYYFYDMESYIVKGPGYGPTGVKDNIEVDLQGIEFAAELAPLSWLSAFFNYTYQWHDIIDRKTLPETDRIDLDELPDHKINIGLRLKPWENGLILLDGRYVTERTTVNNESMDAFFTANMAVQHKFFNRLTVKAYVANVFDEEYRESYGYTMPDRTYGVGVQYEF
jgi:outer membrane receptor protein involved in Fe transport